MSFESRPSKVSMDIGLPSTTAPPLPPPLPPRLEVSDDSSDDVARTRFDAAQKPKKTEGSEEMMQLRVRLSQLRNVAHSFNNVSVPQNRKVLQSFHCDAMKLMDSAAAVSRSPPASLSSLGSPGRYTALRIRRDKQRLEQHYLATLSFLERADAGDSSVLVEEEELGGEAASIATEKCQLQNYALEAMAFLEKAFDQDESILIVDDDSDLCPSPVQAIGDAASIEHDKAELVRYAEEYGEFLEKALEVNSAVDELGSETSIFGNKSVPVGSASLSKEAIESVSNDESHISAVVCPNSQVALRVPMETRSSVGSNEKNIVGMQCDEQTTEFTDEVLERRGERHILNDQLESMEKSSRTQQEAKVRIVVTGLVGLSQEFENVPLQRSFFRKLPRGSTVQIEPVRCSLSSSDNSTYKFESSNRFSAELEKLTTERDSLIAILEDIVNERSMLAVQVGEMKQMILQAGGKKSSLIVADTDDIDLSDDLYTAYETMRTMAEETEETINFLEAKHHKICSLKSTLESSNMDLKTEIANLKSQLKIREESSDKPRLTQEIGFEPGTGHWSASTSWQMELFLKQMSAVQCEIDWSQTLSEVSERQKYQVSRDRTEIMNLKAQNVETRNLNIELQRTADLTRATLSTKLDLAKAAEIQNLDLIASLEREVACTKHESVEFSNEIVRLRACCSQAEEQYEQCLAEVDSLKLEIDKLSTSRDELQSRVISANSKWDNVVEYQTLFSLKEQECSELHRRLTEVERDARVREEQMHRQMRELKEHADRAVTAAALAEQNAGHAAATASAARSNAQAQIDSERETRSALERKLDEKVKELAAKESERQAWETYAREKSEQANEASDSNLSKSSSRRAISNLVSSSSRRGIIRKGIPNVLETDSTSLGASSSKRTGIRDRDDRVVALPEEEKYRRKPYRRFFG